MAKRQFRGRPVNGVLLLDKPTGLSSNEALQHVKSMFNARKAGHTGSLDPLASGMLPICFGEATKFSQFMLDADKVYQVTAKLGVVTDTSDAEGQVVDTRDVGHYTNEQLEEILQRFRGDTLQVPSMFSALKHEGQPLYKLARQGIVVERKARPITLHQLDCLHYSGDVLELYVACTKGTYVRTLVEDIGHALGCGAHVTVLRRLRAGAYLEKDMVTMDSLQALVDQQDWPSLNALLMPDDSMVSDYPDVKMSETSTFYLARGQAVQVSGAPSEGLVRVYSQDNHFLGVCEIDDDGKVAPKRLKMN